MCPDKLPKEERHSAQSMEFSLSSASIDDISSHIVDLANARGADKREVLRLHLSAEETLLRIRDALGEGAVCGFETRRRLGRTFAEVTVKGERLDLAPNDSEEDARNDLLVMLGLAPTHRYAAGTNIFSWPLPRRGLKPFQALVVSIACGIIAGAIMSLSGVGAPLNEMIVAPIRSAYLRGLVAVSQFFVFLSVVRAVYGMGCVADLGRIGSKTISGYVLRTYTCAAIAIAVNLWFYPVQWLGSAGSFGDVLKELSGMLLGIIPANVISPFIDGNVLQIVFLAGVIGALSLMLGERAKPLMNVCDVLYDIFGQLLRLIMKGMYIYIALNLAGLALSEDFDLLLSMRGVLWLAPLTLILCCAAQMFAYCRTARVSFADAWKSFGRGTLIALSTASSMAAYDTIETDLKKNAAVDEKTTSFGIPIGLLLSTGGSAAFHIVMLLCVMQSYSIPITGMLLFVLFVLVPVFSFTVPPVPGGGLTIYPLMLAQFGIPMEAFVVIAVCSTLSDYLETGTNMFLLQTTLAGTAKKLRR